MSGQRDPLPGPAAKLPLLDLRKVEQSHQRQQVEALRRLPCLIEGCKLTCLVVLPLPHWSWLVSPSVNSPTLPLHTHAFQPCVLHCACRQRPPPAACVSSPVPALRPSSPTRPTPLAASATLAMAGTPAAAAAGANRGPQAQGGSTRPDRAPRRVATQCEGARRSTATCTSTMEALGCTQRGWVHAGLQASERDWSRSPNSVCMWEQHARG